MRTFKMFFLRCWLLLLPEPCFLFYISFSGEVSSGAFYMFRCISWSCSPTPMLIFVASNVWLTLSVTWHDSRLRRTKQPLQSWNLSANGRALFTNLCESMFVAGTSIQQEAPTAPCEGKLESGTGFNDESTIKVTEWNSMTPWTGSRVSPLPLTSVWVCRWHVNEDLEKDRF